LNTGQPSSQEACRDGRGLELVTVPVTVERLAQRCRLQNPRVLLHERESALYAVGACRSAERAFLPVATCAMM
jgi:hypothetical protein